MEKWKPCVNCVLERRWKHFVANVPKFICSDCVRSHRRIKTLATHKVVTPQELKEGGAKAIPLKETRPQCAKIMMSN